MNENDLPQDVISEMKFRFEPDFEGSLRILTDYLNKNEYLNHERIIRCVIYLSDNLETLKQNLEVAKTDSRDVMLFAEYEKNDRVRDFNKPFTENRS